MFSCCCTDENRETETINKESVWAAATEEATSANYNYQFVDPADARPRQALPDGEDVPAERAPEAVPEPASEVAEDTTFTAVLERPTGALDPLGLYLDLSDSLTLYVCRMSDKSNLPAHNYNDTVPESRQLKEGDYIVEVNRVKGDAKALADAIQLGSKQLELKVRRPIYSEIVVRKNGHKALGLDLQFARQGWVLSVRKILDGAVKNAGVDIAAGDRILRVNGRRGKTHELLAMMNEHPEPSLTVSRCPEVFAAYAGGFCPEEVAITRVQ